MKVLRTRWSESSHVTTLSIYNSFSFFPIGREQDEGVQLVVNVINVVSRLLFLTIFAAISKSWPNRSSTWTPTFKSRMTDLFLILLTNLSLEVVYFYDRCSCQPRERERGKWMNGTKFTKCWEIVLFAAASCCRATGGCCGATGGKRWFLCLYAHLRQYEKFKGYRKRMVRSSFFSLSLSPSSAS